MHNGAWGCVEISPGLVNSLHPNICFHVLYTFPLLLERRICLTIGYFLTLSLLQVTRQNFSLQYQYNIKQVGDENREEYQSWDY